ncbi:MAG: LCP family protein [Clostridia bacterium]|nr:LCP family protein [Clostridia bacterium]
MKRLLALLLCLALLLPVFSLAESDEDDWDIEDLDIEDLDIDGEEDDEDAIGSEEDTDDDWSNFPDDDQDTIINYDELEINRNCPDEVINILLIGVDTRGNEDRNTDSKLLKDQLGNHNGYAKRNDVNIILSINLFDGSLKLTSIARDLLVDIPSKGTAPINNAFSYRHMKKNGNGLDYVEDVPERVIRTVNRNFQLNIKHYFAINFYGVEEIIEYFGGVDVELTAKEAKAVNSYIKKNAKAMKRTYDMHSEGRQALDTKSDGVQHLDGLQGLVFARTRHVAGENDLQRTGRTRRLLQALFHPIAEKLKNKQLDLLNLIPELTQYMITDMSMQEIVDLAMQVWPVVRDSDMLSDMSSITSLMEEKRIPGDTTKGDLGWSYQDEKVKLRDIQAVTEDLHDFIFGAYYPAD